jgi:hypothetical protein
VHFIPLAYFIFFWNTIIWNIVDINFGLIFSSMLIGYWILIFLDALIKSKNLMIAFLGLIAANIQLLAYGKGFLEEGLKKITNKDL